MYTDEIRIIFQYQRISEEILIIYKNSTPGTANPVQFKLTRNKDKISSLNNSNSNDYRTCVSFKIDVRHIYQPHKNTE